MFKPFFVHYNPYVPGKMSNRAPRGFTAYVTPVDNPRECAISVALCSPKDQFCKREGRKVAAVSESITVNKIKLPKVLASVRAHVDMNTTSAYMGEITPEYNYIYKYML